MRRLAYFIVKETRKSIWKVIRFFYHCFTFPYGTIISSVVDPGCLLRIPDLDFSIPDPWSGFFSTRIRIRNAKLTKNSRRFNSKYSYKALGKMIWIVYPGSRFFPSWVQDPGVKKALDPGSATLIILKLSGFCTVMLHFRTREYVKNMDVYVYRYLTALCTISCMLISCYIWFGSRPLYLHTSIIYILHLSLSFSLSVSRLNDVALPPPPPPTRPLALPRTRESATSRPDTQVREQQQDALLPTWCVQVTAFLYCDFLLEIFTGSQFTSNMFSLFLRKWFVLSQLKLSYCFCD